MPSDMGFPLRRTTSVSKKVALFAFICDHSDTALSSPSREERSRIGAILRAERERKGLDVADLAYQLNLRSSFISAMEDGHGDDHMPWVYERIHQRSVAQLLGISVGSDS